MRAEGVRSLGGCVVGAGRWGWRCVAAAWALAALGGLSDPSASAQVVLSSSATIEHASGLATEPALRGIGPILPCRIEYNGDGSVNPDDLGDFITDYFAEPAVLGPGGYAEPCPENESPYDAGFRAAYTVDGIAQCSPPFADNLGDYITDYFAGCGVVPTLSPLPDFTSAATAQPPLQLPWGTLGGVGPGAARSSAAIGVGTLSTPGVLGVVFAPESGVTQAYNPAGGAGDPTTGSTVRVLFGASWQLTQALGPAAFAGAGLAIGGSLGSGPPCGAQGSAEIELDATFEYVIPGGASGQVRLPAGSVPLAGSASGCGAISATVSDRATGLPVVLPAGTVVAISGTLTLRVRNGAAEAGITQVLAANPERGPAGVFVAFDPPGPPCTCDFNRDGRVDGADLVAFQGAYAAATPGPGGLAVPCPANAAPYDIGYQADFNGDCALTAADQAGFVAAHGTPGPSPICPVDSITSFDQVPGLIAAWDARLSGPTVDANTGEVLDAGVELSGRSSVAVVSVAGGAGPRWSAEPEGLVCLGRYDVAPSQRGMGLRFDLPPGDWSNLKLLVAVCYTPTNMGGDFLDDGMRLVATDGVAGKFSVSRRNARDVVLDPGRSETNGGGGVSLTTTRTGCERQVLAAYSAFPSPGAATAFVNGLGRSGPATATSDQAQTITVGYLGDGAGGAAVPLAIGAFHGILHAVYVYALETAGPANYSERDCRNVSDLLALEWQVNPAPTRAVSVSGDSIVYASGTQHDAVPHGPGTGRGGTVLTAAASAGGVGGATLLVADRAPQGQPISSMGNGGAGRYIIEPGTDRAEVVAVTSGPASGPGAVSLAAPLRFAHPAGSVLADNGYGFINPAMSCWSRSRLTGGDPDVRLFNFAQPAAQLSSIWASNPSSDGSTRVFDSVAGGAAGGRTLFVQRGGNDLNSGVPVPTLFDRVRTFVHNARSAGANPPDRVIVCEVLPRARWSASSNAAVEAYNTFGAGGLSDPSLGADAVCRFTRHPYLSDPECSGAVFVPETLGATTVVGCVYDASGVHPRAFGQACMALAIDAAYAQAWGVGVGYGPATPQVALTAEPGGARLTWSVPTSPGAPAMIGDTTSGASCLVVKINKNGQKMVWIAPLSVNANTGAATYTTTYFDDEHAPGDTYTVWVEDAMGSASPAVMVGP